MKLDWLVPLNLKTPGIIVLLVSWNQCATE